MAEKPKEKSPIEKATEMIQQVLPAPPPYPPLPKMIAEPIYKKVVGEKKA